MFTLRRITSEGLESNVVLGDNYSIIKKESNEEEYKKVLSTYLVHEDADIYGFIIKSDTLSIPLYKKSTYFIMLSDGKTYDNITHR